MGPWYLQYWRHEGGQITVTIVHLPENTDRSMLAQCWID